MERQYQYVPFIGARIEEEAKKEMVDTPLHYCRLVKSLCEKYNFKPGQYFFVWYNGKEVHNVPMRWRWPSESVKANPMIPGVTVTFGHGNPFPEKDVRSKMKEGWYLQFCYD